MQYLEPVDSGTLKKIGINMAVLIGVAFVLAALAATIV